MKKAFLLISTVFILLFTGCKIQQVAGPYIPAKSESKAKNKTEDNVANTSPATLTVAAKPVTRTEQFTLLKGEDTKALHTYHVVIGSFGVETNARRLQSLMRPDYQPIIVRNSKGMYRVLLISYDDYDDAHKKIDEVRAQFPDAWVLIQKK